MQQEKMEKFGTATLQSDLMKVRKANSNAKVGQFKQEKLWFGTYFDLIEGTLHPKIFFHIINCITIRLCSIHFIENH